MYNYMSMSIILVYVFIDEIEQYLVNLSKKINFYDRNIFIIEDKQ